MAAATNQHARCDALDDDLISDSAHKLTLAANTQTRGTTELLQQNQRGAQDNDALSGSSNASTPTATNLVFDTTELLENILLYLPLRDLLQAERVSCRFQQVMLGSKPIRQALFFEPLPKSAIGPEMVKTATGDESTSDRKEAMVMNPLLDRVIGLRRQILGTELLGGYEWNVLPRGDMQKEWSGYEWDVGEDLPTLPGSWSKMLLFQPFAGSCRMWSDFKAETKYDLEYDGFWALTFAARASQWKPELDSFTAVEAERFMKWESEEIDDWLVEHFRERFRLKLALPDEVTGVDLGKSDEVSGWDVLRAV